MKKLTLLTVACLLFFVQSASAQRIDPQKINVAIRKLASPDPDEVLGSVMILAASASPKAVEPLTELLRTGPRNDITNSALEALGAIGNPRSRDLLFEYLGHRRADARITALFALQRYQGRDVISAIESALRDSDRSVRATAAMDLGQRASTSSIPILFLAFDRGVGEAAIAIGQMGSARDAKRLAEYLGKAEVKVLLSGFYELMIRDDVPDKAKFQILDDLLKIAGPEVRRFAVAYQQTFPEGTQEIENKMYRKVSRMIRQLPEN